MSQIPNRRKSAKISPEATISLGDEIRQLRRARRMTLSDLAQAIDKTPGFLSQIERGLTKPSVKTLQDISAALDVQIGWFFTEDVSADNRVEDVNVVRASRRRQLRYSQLKGSAQLSFEDFLLSPNLNGNMVAGLQRFGPGGTWGDEMAAFDCEVFLYMLSGTFVLQFPNRKFTLYAGDSAQYKASELHSGHCPPGEIATLLWVCSPVLLHVTSNIGKGRVYNEKLKRREYSRRRSEKETSRNKR